MLNRWSLVVAAGLLAAMAMVCIVGASAEAASPWHYYIKGPDGSNEISGDKIGQIAYFQFDATAADTVWGNIRIEFDPALLECVSIEESPDTYGFWTGWVTETADPVYDGGGTLFYYDSTGYGSDWAQTWVARYGPLNAGPSGSYDNTLGVIRLYALTDAGGLNGSLPMRIGFRIKQSGTAVFTTRANDSAAFDWHVENLPYIYSSTVNIGQQTCVAPPTGIVAWWPGDGNANDVVNGNTGVLQGGAAFGAGVDQQAFLFDGQDDSVEVPDSSMLDIDNAITIQAWVYINDFRSGNMQVLQKDGTSFEHAYAMPILGEWGSYHGTGPAQPRKFGLELTVHGNWSGDVTGGMWSQAQLQEMTWYHLAATYDGSKVKLYVNGQLDASYDLSGTIETNDSPVRIGNFRAANADFFYGLIDEVQIYNRALSASEIAAVYNAGSAGLCRPENHLPTANAGNDQTVEITSCAGASVTLDGSGSSDPDGDTLTYTWTWPGGSVSGVNPTVTFPYDTTTATLTIDDGKAGTATDTIDIRVVDTIAPTLNVTVEPDLLWPPNHKYVTVTPSIAVNDACVENTQVVLVSVTSSEPDHGSGHDDRANDIVINSDGTVSLRAERSGRGSGRVYTITYKTTDIAGNASTASATVSVPHDKHHKGD